MGEKTGGNLMMFEGHNPQHQERKTRQRQQQNINKKKTKNKKQQKTQTRIAMNSGGEKSLRAILRRDVEHNKKSLMYVV